LEVDEAERGTAKISSSSSLGLLSQTGAPDDGGGGGGGVDGLSSKLLLLHRVASSLALV